MLGHMQDWPLRVGRILDHAAKYHPQRPVIARSPEGPMVQSNWADVHLRARKFSQALRRLGLMPGAHIGIMAWNSVRHIEAWYGIPGAGMVTHTLNPRLFDDQLVYIINHAEDVAIVVDADLVPLIARLRPRLPLVRHYIVLSDRAHMPAAGVLDGALCYEELLATEDGDTDWHPVAETDRCGICYTSGTTGNPKGVAYSHRSNVLHAMTVVQPDMLGLSASDRIMPVVPLFHANGWSIAYSAPLVGASLMLPGRDMSAAALYELLEQGVTFTAAVPTVWLGLLQYMEANELRLSTLRRVVIGGSACPQAVIEKFQRIYGVQVIHAWGMTETSPLGTVCTFKPEVAALSETERLAVQLRCGHPPFTVDMKITDDHGTELPWDGQTRGKLYVRGPGVVGRYLKHDSDSVDAQGWFDTGDVATIDGNAYLRIMDRSKDVIKSGGEWIGSIDLENIAVGHPSVAEAAAVGVAHPKWDERPVLVIVLKPGQSATREEILAQFEGKLAKWQIPDDVIFVPEIPHTATGKISKLMIREQLAKQNYRLPDLR